jgi:hypothetical protein
LGRTIGFLVILWTGTLTTFAVDQNYIFSRVSRSGTDRFGTFGDYWGAGESVHGFSGDVEGVDLENRGLEEEPMDLHQ